MIEHAQVDEHRGLVTIYAFTIRNRMMISLITFSLRMKNLSNNIPAQNLIEWMQKELTPAVPTTDAVNPDFVLAGDANY